MTFGARVSRVLYKNIAIRKFVPRFTKVPHLLKGRFRDDIRLVFKSIFIRRYAPVILNEVMELSNNEGNLCLILRRSLTC